LTARAALTNRRRSLRMVSPSGGRVAQLGARLDGIEEVAGSNPATSTNLRPAGFGWRAIPMWYVYILRSARDNRLYVGSTADLRRRLREHKEGHVASTRSREPLTLEAYIAVKDETTARTLEAYLKTGSGIATLRKRILMSGARRA